MANKNKLMIYRLVLLLLVLAGLFISLFLFIAHIRNYTDLSYSSFCAISKAINCDTVAQSPWSVFLGIPLSLWGLISYLFLLVVSVFSLFIDDRDRRLLPLFLLISFVSSFVSIYLSFISAYKIKSYCIMCILIYAINFLIFYISYKCISAFKTQKFFDFFIKGIADFIKSAYMKLVVSVFIVIIILLYCFLPKYWIYNYSPTSVKVKNGMEKDSRDPWIGADKPVVTIYAYTDYLCFQCRKMHHYLMKLVAANSEKIRLVHVNYPMDHEFNDVVVPEYFHEGSGKLALISEFASDRDDFWKINDALFDLASQRGSIAIDKISEITGLSVNDINLALHHPYFRKSLNYDILRGMKKRIVATPSYVIDDIVYEGIIPSAVFIKAGIE